MIPKYKIEIGYRDMLDGTSGPKHTILISEEQLTVLDTLADIEIDSELNKHYIVNKIKFRITPYFENK